MNEDFVTYEQAIKFKEYEEAISAGISIALEILERK